MNGDYMEDSGGKSGIMPSTFEEIFRALGGTGDDSPKYIVSVSYMEIYKEEIRDLMVGGAGSEKLALKEHPKQGVYVQNLICK